MYILLSRSLRGASQSEGKSSDLVGRVDREDSNRNARSERAVEDADRERGEEGKDAGDEEDVVGTERL